MLKSAYHLVTGKCIHGLESTQESRSADTWCVSAHRVPGVAERRLDTKPHLVSERWAAPLRRVAHRHAAHLGQGPERATARARSEGRDRATVDCEFAAVSRVRADRNGRATAARARCDRQGGSKVEGRVFAASPGGAFVGVVLPQLVAVRSGHFFTLTFRGWPARAAAKPRSSCVFSGEGWRRIAQPARSTTQAPCRTHFLRAPTRNPAWAGP